MSIRTVSGGHWWPAERHQDAHSPGDQRLKGPLGRTVPSSFLKLMGGGARGEAGWGWGFLTTPHICKNKKGPHGKRKPRMRETGCGTSPGRGWHLSSSGCHHTMPHTGGSDVTGSYRTCSHEAVISLPEQCASITKLVRGRQEELI